MTGWFTFAGFGSDSFSNFEFQNDYPNANSIMGNVKFSRQTLMFFWFFGELYLKL